MNEYLRKINYKNFIAYHKMTKYIFDSTDKQMCANAKNDFTQKLGQF